MVLSVVPILLALTLSSPECSCLFRWWWLQQDAFLLITHFQQNYIHLHTKKHYFNAREVITWYDTTSSFTVCAQEIWHDQCVLHLHASWI